ncbi:MAG: 2Fe-2S iron-sulfur cluster-binding protein [Rhizobiaceae bacterium]
MTYIISIADEDISFECEENETVLDAAERAGYTIPYSCRKGVCASCEGGISSGEAMVRGHGLCNTPTNGILLCQVRPLSNLKIVPTRIRKSDPVSSRMHNAMVHKIERPTGDVVIVHLRLPIGTRAVFRPGQYLRVLMPDGDSRNYSIANSPHKNDKVELHIRHVSGGKFSQSVLASLGKGDILKLELPFGEFTLSDNDSQVAILVATGTGFAPIKSIIEHQIHQGNSRAVHLYWGADTEAGIYTQSVPEKWAAKYPWFRFTPVLSGSCEKWAGRRGWVHNAIQKDYPDMSGLEVYACGAPVMIDAARKDFVALAGLKREAFYCDAFVPSGDLVDATEPIKVSVI